MSERSTSELRPVPYMHHLTERITHTTSFVTPVVEHWLEREIAQKGPNSILMVNVTVNSWIIWLLANS